MGNSFSIVFQFIGFMFIFAAILFLVIIVTRLLGSKAKLSMKGKYINIIESVSIGIDKQIYLLKVSDQFILIASCGKSIEFLSNVNIENPDEIMEPDGDNIFNFKSILDKYVMKNKKENNQSKELTEKNSIIDREKLFNNNLQKIRNITRRNRIQQKIKYDGTEKENENH